MAKGTRMLVIPASKSSKALDEGLLKIFVDAGALVSAPCCGPCLGGHTGIIGPGEVSLSTSNETLKVDKEALTESLFIFRCSSCCFSREGKVFAWSEYEELFEIRRRY